MDQLSRHTIFDKITDREEYYLINLLSGNADLLTEEDKRKFEFLEANQSQNTLNFDSDPFYQDLTEKGYLQDPLIEKRTYRNHYYKWLDDREKEEIQLFYVMNYSCNFGCFYCYQDEYSQTNSSEIPAVTDAFFDYVDRYFAGRKKYITLFGGEPLLNTPQQRSLIKQLIDRTNQRGLQLCYVTNGYHLCDYLDLISEGNTREIQVTLDGTALVHNNRRMLKGGGATFDRIVEGIDATLELGIPINLRMVIDKENCEEFGTLAHFAIDRGWTKNPLFKTQIGRNYELHHCQSTPDKLFTRKTLYEKIYQMILADPALSEFYQPSYSVSKHLAQQGALPDPLFDACPACKSEWAFDYTGHIYSCTATVGKSDESLGTFYPHVSLHEAIINEWESRDVTSIPECRSCNLQLACGGGCGSVAKNKTGKIHSPDCRPIKELLSLGFAAYLK